MDRHLAQQLSSWIVRILQYTGLPLYYVIQGIIWLTWWTWKESTRAYRFRYRRTIRAFRSLFEHRWTRFSIGIALVLVCLGLSSLGTDQVQADFTFVDPDQKIVLSDESLALTTGASVRAPVEHVFLTQGYHPGHFALDLVGDQGDPIYPIMAGKVVATIRDRVAYGNHIVIEHGAGLESLYAHLSRIDVEVGDKVTIDDQIGEMGRTGNATGDHLHLEVIDQGKQINPLTLIVGK